MHNSDIPSRAELPTTRQLTRSTIVALAAAAAILVTVVLPAEYAIDPTGVGRLLRLTEMGQIKSQLAKEAEADRLRDNETNSKPEIKPQSHFLNRIFSELFVGVAYAQTPTRKDETVVKLKSGEGAEVKLIMVRGAKVNYSWKVDGGKVNFDLHGDAKGKETSYQKGRDVPGAEGILEAGFDGAHGWFWRNRGNNEVTITLRTEGAYSEIKKAK